MQQTIGFLMLGIIAIPVLISIIRELIDDLGWKGAFFLLGVVIILVVWIMIALYLIYP